MRRFRSQAVALAVLAVAATGCSDGEDTTQRSTAEEATTSSSPVSGGGDEGRRQASKALARDGSAPAAVLTLVRDVRDGAGPIVLPAYDDRIPQRVGATNVIGALDMVRQIAQGSEPVIVRERRATTGQLVVVRLLREGAADPTYSFLVRRKAGRWLIAYDGLLAEALQSYVQNRRAANPAKPTKADVEAGAEAVTQLKLAARMPSGSRSSTATATTP